MKIWALIFPLCVSVLWTNLAALAQSPSFDCRKAKSLDEIAICSDPALAKNDRLTTQAFNEAKRQNRSSALQIARTLMQKRANCGADRDCIADAQTRAALDYGLLGAKLPKAEPEQRNASAVGQIKFGCAQKWPSDYSMQEYCIKEQTDAILELSPIIDSKSDIQRKIFGECAYKWKTQFGFDYKMVSYCYNEQFNAYRRLNGG